MGDVDAGRTARLFTGPAVDAARSVDDRPEQAEAAEGSQQRADRANSMAVRSAIAPGQDSQDDEINPGQGHGSQRRPEDIRLAQHRNPAVAFVDPDQSVPAIGNWQAQSIVDDAAKDTVRVDQPHKTRQAGQESQTGQHQDTIAHDAPFPPESKFLAILFAPFGQPEDEVLADAQGTEDAAIDPSQEQGQDDDDGDDQEIPSQESRQDLPLRQHGCYDTSKGQDHGPHQEPR
ncbi:unknown [Megasphaera elsdenii CAG:570]|uniref:Uncharacterized protein n=1 Tax=Megasphaera elsdenii CAG:570 TaxID=1263087 RepID=R7MY91_MEGEL|nr:unknown [Megasphaera elsdenii CAG:570]